MASLAGKNVIISGGSSGIGRALTTFFASKHSNITILDLSPPPSLPIGNILYCKCDIASWDSQAAAFEAAANKFGGVDIVCANAGIPEVGKLLDDMGEPDLKTLDVNLKGTLFSIKLAAHYMQKNLGEKKGAIVCTASNAGLYAFPVAPVYAVSKWGVVGAVRSLGPELEKRGVRILGVCPNVIKTEIADANLFKGMIVTPMSTVVQAVDEFVTDEAAIGGIVEVSGETIAIREPYDFLDDATRRNLKEFEVLGHA